MTVGNIGNLLVVKLALEEWYHWLEGQSSPSWYEPVTKTLSMYGQETEHSTGLVDQSQHLST